MKGEKNGGTDLKNDRILVKTRETSLFYHVAKPEMMCKKMNIVFRWSVILF